MTPRNIYQHWLRLVEHTAMAAMVLAVVGFIGWALRVPGLDLEPSRLMLGAGIAFLVWAFAGVLSRVPQDE